MNDKELIAEIRDGHERQDRREGEPPMCLACSPVDWPCDAVRAADALDAATRERDAALAAIGRVQETLSLHNPNGRLVKEVLAALDGAPEPEWEYQCTNNINTTELLADPELHAKRCSGKIERRRKAGPWLPVEGESTDA